MSGERPHAKAPAAMSKLKSFLIGVSPRFFRAPAAPNFTEILEYKVKCFVNIHEKYRIFVILIR
jgi:hypothetical protein